MKKLSDADRYNYHEGKIWALEYLLGAALQAGAIRDLQVDEVFKQALENYPGARDSESYIGKGVEEIFNHVRNRLQASCAVGMVPETTARELARALVQGMPKYSDSPIVFNVARAMEAALRSNDWPELERLACSMNDAIERDVPTN